MSDKCEDIASFPTVDYRLLRRDWVPTETLIPFDENDNSTIRQTEPIAPKPERFSKLHNWDEGRTKLYKNIAIAAGVITVALACAAPTILNIPH